MSEGGEFQARKPEMTEKESLAIPHKKNTGMAVAVVLLAVCVLGLGGYIALDKTILSRDVANTSTNSENQVNCLSADNKVEQNSSDNTNIADTDVAFTENASDYIYVAEWGIKIKKPSSNYFYFYRFVPDTGSDRKGVLAFTVAPTDSQANPAWVDDFLTGTGFGTFTIDRYNHESENVGMTLIGEKDGYYYYLTGKQACSYGNQDACSREWAIYEELSPSFLDINNYVSF